MAALAVFVARLLIGNRLPQSINLLLEKQRVERRMERALFFFHLVRHERIREQSLARSQSDLLEDAHILRSRFRAREPSLYRAEVIEKQFKHLKEIEEALWVHGGGRAGAEALGKKSHEPIFRPDMDWSSARLSSLLGVDVIVDPKSFRMPHGRKKQLANAGKKIIVGMCVAVTVLALAAGLGIGLLYLFEVGPFYTNADRII